MDTFHHSLICRSLGIIVGLHQHPSAVHTTRAVCAFMDNADLPVRNLDKLHEMGLHIHFRKRSLLACALVPGHERQGNDPDVLVQANAFSDGNHSCCWPWSSDRPGMALAGRDSCHAFEDEGRSHGGLVER